MCGCEERRKMMNARVPGSGDAFARVAEPVKRWWGLMLGVSWVMFLAARREIGQAA